MGLATLEQLHTICEEVDFETDKVYGKVDYLKELIRKYDLGGASGPEIGYLKRLFVVVNDKPANITWFSEAPTLEDTITMVNPEVRLQGVRYPIYESCQIGYSGFKLRAYKVNVTFQDIDGNEFQAEMKGRLAQFVQHEFDHLNGILVNNFKPLQRLIRWYRSVASPIVNAKN